MVQCHYLHICISPGCNALAKVQDLLSQILHWSVTPNDRVLAEL